MRDTELYQTLLGLNAPWEVTAVDVTQASDECPLGEIAVRVRWQPDAPLRCPACGAVAPGYDTRTRRWAAVATGPTAGTATAWMALVWLSTFLLHTSLAIFSDCLTRLTKVLDTRAEIA